MAFVDIGVGTAMMYGAAAGAVAGGAYNASQGKNVLNGALIGGLAGGALGGGAAGLAGAGWEGLGAGMVDSAGNIVGGGAEGSVLGVGDTGGLTAEEMAAGSGNPATSGLVQDGVGNTMDNSLTNGVAGTNTTTSPGTGNVLTKSAEQAMTTPSWGSVAKYGIPAAMALYGTGIFGNKVYNQGITSQSTVGQSTPSSNMINAGLASNYRAAPALAAAEGGIMKLATGGTGTTAAATTTPSMTPAVTQSTYNPADVNTAQSSTLSPSTEALLSQYGISSSQAQQGLSALQNAGVLGSTTTQTAVEGGIIGLAAGGNTSYNLGGYSDGGRLLKGPGDGMSDEIPATIAHKQPARLAEGEFVVPADVVSHLGNGSTDAGAKHLYKMMDNVRQARTGNKKQGKQIKAEKYLPK
jgi:hypothetical protein